MHKKNKDGRCYSYFFMYDISHVIGYRSTMHSYAFFIYVFFPVLVLKMGTGSFPGVERPGRGADHPPSPKRRGHERVELYLYSPSGSSWPVIGRTLLFFLN